MRPHTPSDELDHDGSTRADAPGTPAGVPDDRPMPDGSAPWPVRSSTPSSAWDFPAPPAALEELMAEPLTPQRRFEVPKASWLRKLRAIPNAAEAIAGLPSRMNRDDAVAAFAARWPDDVIGAFTVTMAWAYGERAGYAGHRVARILTASSEPDGMGESPRVREALRRSLDVAARGGAVEGFSHLNDCTHKVKSHQRDEADLLVGVDCGRVYGLGPSFFTKWLHIGSLALSREAASAPPPAPMLDMQAISWLEAHARSVDEACLAQDEARKLALAHTRWHTDPFSPKCTEHCPFLSEGESLREEGMLHPQLEGFGWSPTTPEGDLLRLRSGRTDDYARYVALLTTWGEPHRLSAADVGDRIYRLIRNDGVGRPRAA